MADLIKYEGNKLDQGFRSTTNKPRKLETKVIKYEEEGNELKISSMAHMSLPFFTKRKKGRNLNLVYEIGFLGLVMKCSLSSDSELTVQQPGEFEESLYDFLLQTLYKRYKNTKDVKASHFLADEYLTFEVRELVEYLGVKYSPAYVTKIKKALENLKKTTYSFNRKNKKKSDKRILDFEDQDVVLINYEMLKVGKKHYYKVKVNNPIAVEAFEKNLIMHFTDESIKSIVGKSKLAERIYKYISMNRFNEDHGETTINKICSIIPYELSGTYVKKGKIYKRSRMKEASNLINKNFDILIKAGYIKNYEMTKEGVINYVFSNEKLGLVTGFTLEKHYKAKKAFEIKKEKKIKNAPSKIAEEGSKSLLQDSVMKAKKNIFVSKAWNKRVDNKIVKIVSEQGEEYAIKILGAIYHNLNQEVSTTLVKYINGIMKNTPVGEQPILKKSEKTEKIKKTPTSKSVEKIKIQSMENLIKKNISMKNNGGIQEAEIIESEKAIVEVQEETIDETNELLYKALYTGAIAQIKANKKGAEKEMLLKSIKSMKTVASLTGFVNGLS